MSDLARLISQHAAALDKGHRIMGDRKDSHGQWLATADMMIDQLISHANTGHHSRRAKALETLKTIHRLADLIAVSRAACDASRVESN